MGKRQITGPEKVMIHRKRQDISIAEAADRVGCSRSYLWKVESGDHKPSPDLAVKIANLLGLDTDELLGDFGHVAPDIAAFLVSNPDAAKRVRSMIKPSLEAQK